MSVSKIPVSAFISKVEEIAAEEPKYNNKGCHDGSDGECDCIGLIIGAIRRAGGQWRGLHGSNYAARQEIENLKPVTATSELEIGEAVFKAYEPGQGGYDLPDRYTGRGQYANGDLRDYYHVGIVESVYPLRIRHMTTPRVRMDTSIDKWAYHGRLKKVDYNSVGTVGSASGGGGKKLDMDAKVVLTAREKGSSINLREGPGKNYGRVRDMKTVNVGAIVTVLEDGGEWCRIQAGSVTGYIMSNHLEYINGEASSDIDRDAEKEKIDKTLSEMEAIMIEIEKKQKEVEQLRIRLSELIETIGSANGRG